MAARARRATRRCPSHGSWRPSAIARSGATSLAHAPSSRRRWRRCSPSASGSRVPADPRADRGTPHRGARRTSLTPPSPSGVEEPPVGQEHDFDWLVVGRVRRQRVGPPPAQKGYRVGCSSAGGGSRTTSFPSRPGTCGATSGRPLGMHGIFRLSLFKDVSIVSGAGVAAVPRLREHALPGAPALLRGRAVGGPRRLGDGARAALRRGRADARRGAYDQDVPADDLLRGVRARDRLGRTRTRRPASASSSATAPARRCPTLLRRRGPDRDGCMRCGRCMVGCPHGAKNTLPRTTCGWPSARRGGRPERRSSTSCRSARPTARTATSDHRAPGAWLRSDRRLLTARGVVIAAGPLGTNRLLASLQAARILPRVSDGSATSCGPTARRSSR